MSGSAKFVFKGAMCKKALQYVKNSCNYDNATSEMTSIIILGKPLMSSPKFFTTYLNAPDMCCKASAGRHLRTSVGLLQK